MAAPSTVHCRHLVIFVVLEHDRRRYSHRGLYRRRCPCEDRPSRSSLDTLPLSLPPFFPPRLLGLNAVFTARLLANADDDLDSRAPTLTERDRLFLIVWYELIRHLDRRSLDRVVNCRPREGQDGKQRVKEKEQVRNRGRQRVQCDCPQAEGSAFQSLPLLPGTSDKEDTPFLDHQRLALAHVAPKLSSSRDENDIAPLNLAGRTCDCRPRR